MALVTVSNRDQKLIIWNFMEELWENYQNAIENKLDTQFKLMDFYNVGLLIQYLKEEGVEIISSVTQDCVGDLERICEENRIYQYQRRYSMAYRKGINRMSET